MSSYAYHNVYFGGFFSVIVSSTLVVPETRFFTLTILSVVNDNMEQRPFQSYIRVKIYCRYSDFLNSSSNVSSPGLIPLDFKSGPHCYRFICTRCYIQSPLSKQCPKYPANRRNSTRNSQSCTSAAPFQVTCVISKSHI